MTANIEMQSEYRNLALPKSPRNRQPTHAAPLTRVRLTN